MLRKYNRLTLRLLPTGLPATGATPLAPLAIVLPPPALRLLIPLLDTDGTALPLQRLGQRCAGAHAGEILGREHGEDVALHLGDGRHPLAGLEGHGLEAHQDEAQPVAAMRAAAEVREAEEAPLDVVLVGADEGGRHERAHQAARITAVGAGEPGLVRAPVGAP